MLMVGVGLTSSAAFAKTTDRGVVTPLPKAVTLADNVVVTPQGGMNPAPAPAPTTTKVVPAQPAQPVVVEPSAPARAHGSHRTRAEAVHVDHRRSAPSWAPSRAL